MNYLGQVISFLAAMCCSISLNAQVQNGADIEGEAAGDDSGYSVSMPDSNTMAIGAHFNDDNGTDAGQVRIYRWDGSAWVQKGADIDGDTASDNSGWSVSMCDSNTVAVGAPLSNAGAGNVSVYYWNSSAWIQKGYDIIGEASVDWSGYSVSMPDSNTVAIGAIYNDGSGVSAGQVRIYRWNGIDWIQKGGDIDGEAANDWFGNSVSMPDANNIAIGARYNDGNGNGSGHVRVFYWNGSTWTQKGLDIDGEASGDYSGWSVSMPDSNTLAIGAPQNYSNGPYSGQVRIYNWNGSAWIQKGGDIGGEAAGDQSGISVSMADANTLAIGAHLNNDGGTSAGQVRVYAWNGTNWVQTGTDIDGEAANDWSGNSVNMPDVTTIAIGAPKNDGTGIDAGHVRVYSVLCPAVFSNIIVTSCGFYTSPSTNYTWNASGIYSDTIPNSVGCDSIITINLTILPSPSVNLAWSGATSFCLGDSLVLNAITSASNQQWYRNGNAIPGANGLSYTVHITGNYHCLTSSGPGCSDTSSIVSVNVPCIIYKPSTNPTPLKGASDISESLWLEVAPNPSSGDFTIRGTSGNVTIYSLFGTVVKQGALNNGTFNVDNSLLSKGIYLAVLELNGEKISTIIVHD